MGRGRLKAEIALLRAQITDTLEGYATAALAGVVAVVLALTAFIYLAYAVVLLLTLISASGRDSSDRRRSSLPRLRPPFTGGRGSCVQDRAGADCGSNRRLVRKEGGGAMSDLARLGRQPRKSGHGSRAPFATSRSERPCSGLPMMSSRATAALRLQARSSRRCGEIRSSPPASLYVRSSDHRS